MKMEQSSTKLKKELGLLASITIVIGMVIGSGIFFKPAIVFKNAGSPIMGIMAWVIGGLITVASGLTIAEIAVAIPKTGGVFIYLKELYGEKWAFLFGWVQTVVYVPGSVAAQAIILATQLTSFIDLNHTQQQLLAIFFLFFIAAMNIISTKLGGKIQVVATIAKLIPIAVIIVLGFMNGTAKGIVLNTGGQSAFKGLGAAILGTLWAYDGWVSIGNMAGELKNPKKDLPRSIILGLSLVIVVYTLINIALIKIMPVDAIINSSKPASDAATVLFGSVGAKFISAGIAISIFGALNGYMMTGVRIPFAMAQDKQLPFSDALGSVNKKLQTPINSFILVVVLASLYVLSGSFNTLTDLVMFILWIFFTMAIAGIFILRRKFKHIKTSYRVPLYPVVPLIGIIGSIYIIVSTLITNISYAVFGTVITLLGLPVYYYLKNKKN